MCETALAHVSALHFINEKEEYDSHFFSSTKRFSNCDTLSSSLRTLSLRVDNNVCTNNLSERSEFLLYHSEKPTSDIIQESIIRTASSCIPSLNNSTKLLNDSKNIHDIIPTEISQEILVKNELNNICNNIELPNVKNALLLENVLVKDPIQRKTRGVIINQIQKLSEDIFNEDITQFINKKTRWQLHLLVTQNENHLLGFISYRIRPQNVTLEISKLAVPEHCRKKGYGRRLVNAVIRSARQSRTIESVALSSLKESVAFYERLGFHALANIKTSEDPDDMIIPGQVYMELKTGRKKKRR